MFSKLDNVRLCLPPFPRVVNGVGRAAPGRGGRVISESIWGCCKTGVEIREGGVS